ncbi:MAG: allophanate hydrolase [Bauldia sp.]
MSGITDLPFTIAALRGAYAEGLKPAAIVDEVFRRLAVAQDPGIFITMAPRSALLAVADALGAFDPARPLWGVPVAVKDNIDVEGLATTAACREYAYNPQRDAEAVRRLRNAGALIVGKTNLDQFATGLVGVRTPHPVPRNSIDPNLVPGGSSSGSAVAVARGIVAVSLGTDTAGSGRVPAAFNNIVGLKPSNGAVSSVGMVPACRSLDCTSVFALDVEDAWTTFEALASFDERDPYARPLPPPAVPALPPRLRIGVPEDDDRIFSSPHTRAAYDAALETAARIGADIVEVDFDAFFDVGTLLYGGPWVAERHAATRGFFSGHADAMLPVIREIIGRSTLLSAADAFDGLYKLRTLERATSPIWDAVDILCVPSIPGPVTRAEITADPFAANARLGTYTNFVNLLGLCGLTIPTGTQTDGAPASVTFLGRNGDDGRLAAFGRSLHLARSETMGATGWPLPQQEWPARGAKTLGIPLMVFGAHLSGLPLNHELLEAGAIFTSVALTAPDYRLHALPGAKARPGLVRVAPDTGVSVVGEIWTLPVAGFGSFVASVVPPLAIGTIRLDDGSTVKGFLAEAEGVRGTPDISHHGGWRAYLNAKERRPRAAG